MIKRGDTTGALSNIASDDCRRLRATERRFRIAQAAEQLFIELGFHATGVAKIAENSGVRINQLYRDFSSKEDLIAEVVQAHVERILDKDGLCGAVQRRDIEAARAWLRRFVKEARHSSASDKSASALFAEIYAEASRNERIASIVRDVDNRVRQHVVAALEVIAPGAKLAARRIVLARTIVALSCGLWYTKISDPDGCINEVADFSFNMIETELMLLENVSGSA